MKIIFIIIIILIISGCTDCGAWPPSQKEIKNFKEIIFEKNPLKKNFYIVLDGSGSMADPKCSGDNQKIDVAKKALSSFVDLIDSNDNLGLMAFDTKGTTQRVALKSNNKSEIKKAIKAVEAGDGTPLSSAINIAYNALKIQAYKQQGYGQYHIIIVTDGEANIGYDPRNLVNQIVYNSLITIHTVGFCIDEGHSLNQPGLVIYKSANNPKELAQGLESVLAETTKY